MLYCNTPLLPHTQRIKATKGYNYTTAGIIFLFMAQ